MTTTSRTPRSPNTTTSLRSMRAPGTRMARMLIAIVAVAAVVLGLGGTAFAAGPNASFDEYGPGYSDVISGEDAGSYFFTVGGERIEAYCVEMHKTFNTNGSFEVRTQSGAGVSGIGAAAWLAANHTSVGSPLADSASEKAAVQVAIWAYTDGATIDESTVASPSIRDRANELVAAASGKSSGGSATTYQMNVTSTVGDENATVVATVASAGGSGVEGVDVSFETADGVVVVATGADGSAAVDVSAPEAGATETISVRAPMTVAAGAALVPGDGTQVMVTADSFTQVLSAVVSFTGNEVEVEDELDGTDVAPPTTTATPTTTSTAYEEVLSELPMTGGGDGLIALLAGLGLALLGYAASRRAA